MIQRVADVPTTAVSANSTGDPGTNSDLWLLMGNQNTHTIRQLRVPAGTNQGATLVSTDHGTVTGPAAVAVSTREADGTGGDVVAVAGEDGIDLFAGAARAGHVAVHAPSGVDAILPATDQQGSFAFLYHSPAGWSLVTTPTDGSDTGRVAPLGGIGTTDLAVPAESNGALYTMDRTTGALWRITLNGHVGPVPTVSHYPRVAGETTAFSQATVFARGARVIFNSRANLEALTVFTDGTHKPVVIDKRTAVDLNSNGAAALANLHNAPPGANTAPKGQQDAPTAAPSEPVTDRIDCKNTTQVPHIPSVELVDKGSRSVQLRWTYPLLDRQDCAASTYTVSVEVVSGTAPSPPGTMKVQGVTGLNITGLFPDTQYRIVVNAYINGKHTPSKPLLVRTQPEGPAAPTNLRVGTDDQGNWKLRWNSCGGVEQGCVPVDSWTIIPQLCESSGGLVSAPKNGRLVGDPTTHTFTYTYAGGPGLLGSGLRFTVEGLGDNTTGDPASSTQCVHSWAHPVADDIRVAASTPPETTQGGSSTTTVTVSFTGEKDVALGGAGGQLTYRLLSDDSLVRQKGPTSATTVSLGGVRPGLPYQVQVIVAPPGHATQSVALPKVDVEPAVAKWPAIRATATFAPDKRPSSTGTLNVTLTGLTSADARGETFDIADGQLICGNTAMALTATDFDPATPLHFGHVDRGQYNGACSVQLSLAENPDHVRSPAYFGGTTSPVITSPGVPVPVPDLDASASQFVAHFVNCFLCTPQVALVYAGDNDLMAGHAVQWQLQAQYPNGNGGWSTCGDVSDQNPARSPVLLNLDPSCYYANHAADWRVSITFSYFGQSPPTPYAVDVNGSGSKPVDPTRMSFTAAWAKDTIIVNYDGAYNDATLQALTWTQKVTSDKTGTVCGTDQQTPSSFGPMRLTADLTRCPPGHAGPPTGSNGTPPSGSTATYTVEIRFTDPNYGNSGDYLVTVSGAPS